MCPYTGGNARAPFDNKGVAFLHWPEPPVVRKIGCSMARQYHLKSAPAVELPKIDYAQALNPQQCAAVTAPPGPALVIAGAGSGKTRTLIYRVAYLLENAVQPANILLLTFTNKAAREMMDRLADLVPNDIGGLWGGTFHSIGNRLLRRHAREAGFAKGFSILDREDQEDMLKTVIGNLEIKGGAKTFPKAGVLGDVLSFALNTGRSIADVLAEKHPDFLEFEDEIAAARKAYEARKKVANALDFDDLLEKTVQMFRQDAGLAAFYQQQFQFILVDEYQDTNHLQAEFIDILAAKHRNVMAVGDDAQAIYAWRGADFKNILEFPKRYRDAVVYKIETNYRSTPEVLEVANAAIAGNVEQFRKELVAARTSGMQPALVPLMEPRQQALFVAQRITELQDEGRELSDIAVLYRSHFHSMEIQMEFTRHGIPFNITSGLRFFEQAHVKDVAAFLKFAVNPRDEVAFKRMARLLPGIGARSADQLWLKVSAALRAEPAEGEAGEPAAVSFRKVFLALKTPEKSRSSWEQLAHTLEELAPDGALASPGSMITSVIEAIYDDYARAEFPNYEQRREDLNTLGEFASEYEDAAEFLDQLALLTGLDDESAAGNKEAPRVTLSSVHQAKGLEWKAVFVIFLADGMFPSARSLESAATVEEERRLFYVAVTRAMDELYLLYPHQRSNVGYGELYLQPSRFLREIPQDLLEEWHIGGGY